MVNIPQRLNELLAKDHLLNSFVLSTAGTVGPWARDNKTPFFPEYTDHSLIHLNEVIASADSLISDDAWSLLTPEDAAVLITAVLLHDCAMHLSEDGFWSLIDGNRVVPTSRYVESETIWPKLWSDFLAEAKRFDQRKLVQLFGDAEPPGELPTNKLSLTLRHRLLIGEFLRRHHARLAHEIALSGIPGPDGKSVIIGSAPTEFLDLCGFVARSHNLSIRDAVEAIEPNKRRIHQNCRVPFVMSVLRIADYIQVHSPRAPKQLLHLKALVSPISRQEWKKHECVVELNQAHEDPEAIFADAEPRDVKTFVSLRNLFQDIQRELDEVWATLGEIYGRFAPLHDLGITIRRIRSALDDPDQFREQKRPSFIPRPFAFRTASGELMDLLVTPLYGARPQIGVRELVQNSVDACLERDDLVAKGLVTSQEITGDDVVVTLTKSSEDDSTLTVEDYGVGMTEDVIDKYFLNVGASFRSSDLWRKNHESKGHSDVHRTGRFGVGVLAAFLLGDEITVTTRHISLSPEAGLSFTCRRGDAVIEVRPTSFHHGTKIEVRLHKSALVELSARYNDWDWFCLETPKVSRRIIGVQKTHLDQRFLVPSCQSQLDKTNWQRIDAPGFDDVIWTYDFWNVYRNHGLLICNGIFVTESLYRQCPQISPELDCIPLKTPTVVVSDADGRFPLNLQRNEVSATKMPFDAELADSISALAAQSLAEAFEGTSPGISQKMVELSLRPKMAGLVTVDRYAIQMAPVTLTKKGVVPTDLSLLWKFKPKSLFLDPCNITEQRGAWSSEEAVKEIDAYLAVGGVTKSKLSRTLFLRMLLDSIEAKIKANSLVDRLPLTGLRIFIRNDDVKELVTPGNVPRGLWKRLSLEISNDEWGIWSLGKPPKLEFDLDKLGSELSENNCFGFAKLYFDWTMASGPGAPERDSPFASAWLARVGGPELKL